MPVDVAAMNASLANDYGATKGANAPASHTLNLYAGDPAGDGIKLTGGYTPPTITNDGTAWPAPAGGMLTGAVVTISYTAALTDADGTVRLATHWCLEAAGVKWDAGEVPEGPWAGGAGVSDAFSPTIMYAAEAD